MVVALPAYGRYDLDTTALGVGAEVLQHTSTPKLAREPGSFARFLGRVIPPTNSLLRERDLALITSPIAQCSALAT